MVVQIHSSGAAKTTIASFKKKLALLCKEMELQDLILPAITVRYTLNQSKSNALINFLLRI